VELKQQWVYNKKQYNCYRQTVPEVVAINSYKTYRDGTGMQVKNKEQYRCNEYVSGS